MLKFDEYARNYEELLSASLGGSGESPAYFAQYKIECLKQLGFDTNGAVLDYGCGIGQLTSRLHEVFAEVHGYDPSTESLDIAQQRSPGLHVARTVEDLPDGHFSAIIVANVLHHVPPVERESLLTGLVAKLCSHGKLIVFEHNPWNPLTRLSVLRCPFDDDAILLRPRNIRRLVARCGLSRVRQDFIVFFPSALKRLRSFEPRLSWCPLGAQTMTIAER
jgi:SAM-dependent methyltransferase